MKEVTRHSTPEEIERFVNLLFRPGEHVNYRKEVTDTRVYPVNERPDDTEQFCLNPLMPVDLERGLPWGRRSDLNITHMRNILLEIDDPSMTMSQQMEYIESLGIPWSTCCYSGGKSLHFVIALEEPISTREEWDQTLRWIHAIARKIDHQPISPSSGSRFPGAIRSDTQQEQSIIKLRDRVTRKELDDWLQLHPQFKPIPKPPRPPLKPGERRHFNRNTMDLLTHGAPQGERNKRVFLAALDMAECGYPEEEILERIEKCPLRLPRHEILVAVRSALKRIHQGED